MASYQNYSFSSSTTSSRLVCSSQNSGCSSSQVNYDANSSASLMDCKKKHMVNLMNLTAKKIHELKGVLLQESQFTGEQFDDNTLDPLIRRFTQQVNEVDPKLSSSNTTQNLMSSSSLRNFKSYTTKQTYHYYLEELQQYDLRQVDIGDLFNQTYNRQSLPPSVDDSICRDSSSLLSFETRKTEFENKQIEPTEKAFNSRNSELESKTEQCAQLSEDISDFDEDETDLNATCYPNRDVVDTYYAKERSEPEQVKPKYSSSPFRTHQDKTEEILYETCEHKPGKNNYDNSKSLDHLNNNEINADKNCSSDVQCSPSTDTVDHCTVFADRYKMRRKKQRVRPKLDEVFPLEDFGRAPQANNTLLQGPENGISVDQDQSSILCGESLGSPWANQSKHANESWYEFKERCSSSSLQQQRLLYKLSPSRSTFQLKDYIPDSTQTTPTSSGKKTVRFSNGSSSTIPQMNRYRYRQTRSSDSSSDDDPGFNVKQFPCLDRRQWSGEYLSGYPE